MNLGSSAQIFKGINWKKLKDLADVQGLSAVVLDGMDKLNTNDANFVNMSRMLRLEWIGEVLQNYEARYKAYEKAIGTLAGWYNTHGFKMMVLKGYACALDWPRPEHRPSGDIDVWLFGQQKEADAALLNLNDNANPNKIKIDTSHHHHTVFEWHGFTVENHYDFVNVHVHKSSKEFEVIFKELGDVSNISDNDNFNAYEGSPDGSKSDKNQQENLLTSKDSGNSNQGRELENSGLLTAKGTRITSVEVYGERVYIPSPNLHALFLMRHLANHFVAAEINLRQVLDWAFFVEMHTSEIDWGWVEGVLQKFHLVDFYHCINAICVGDLGFNVKIFPPVQFDPQLKDKIFKEILAPEFSGNLPSNLFKRVVFKYRRWKANEWKHKLCYDESRWAAFWSGVWSHILKLKSI